MFKIEFSLLPIAFRVLEEPVLVHSYNSCLMDLIGCEAIPSLGVGGPKHAEETFSTCRVGYNAEDPNGKLC